MIELQHLTKRFATQGGTVVALNDINLTIRDGDVYGIIGMSGAGKSTLVRCINMLERPDEGNVIVNGKQMQDLRAADLRAARREITMIFQQFNLLPIFDSASDLEIVHKSSHPLRARRNQEEIRTSGQTSARWISVDRCIWAWNW
mgnify:CR=1 FL=1